MLGRISETVKHFLPQRVRDSTDSAASGESCHVTFKLLITNDLKKMNDSFPQASARAMIAR